MEFWKTLLALSRRRRVGFPLLGLTLLTAALTFALVPVRHVSSTSMVLTTPPAGGTLDPIKPQGRSNPLLQFSDGLRTTAGILILAMNTKAVMAELGVTEDGPTEVVINDGRNDPSMMGILTNGPFVYVKVESGSADTVRTVMSQAQVRLRSELTRRQEVLGAPASTFIGLVDVVPPGPPEANRSGPARAAGGAAFLVALLGLGTAYTVERRRVFRRRSGDGRAEVPPPATSTVTSTAADTVPADPADAAGTGGPEDPAGPAGARGTRGRGVQGTRGQGGTAERGDAGVRDDREPPVVLYPAHPAGRGADDQESGGRGDREPAVVHPAHPAQPAGRGTDGPESTRAMRRRRRRAAARRADGTRSARRRR
ncbi:hypothetical protein [Streptosporangium longisporum]|uniref:Polysaccharide chain length determinant N-terminal domain-containing protein n=1 Tax=Streptosporangium longisporum TaxID=46187 RepID=A0ABN3XUB0_9ACTN